jgi:hypothetical protein
MEMERRLRRREFFHKLSASLVALGLVLVGRPLSLTAMDDTCCQWHVERLEELELTPLDGQVRA